MLLKIIRRKTFIFSAIIPYSALPHLALNSKRLGLIPQPKAFLANDTKMFTKKCCNLDDLMYKLINIQQILIDFHQISNANLPIML